jgi:hypothetical protein
MTPHLFQCCVVHADSLQYSADTYMYTTHLVQDTYTIQLVQDTYTSTRQN